MCIRVRPDGAGLVVETGSAREVHHFSVLAGYGAEAVHPYLALETLAALHDELPSELGTEKATYNYITAIGSTPDSEAMTTRPSSVTM